jgi:hypothetical protein
MVELDTGLVHFTLEAGHSSIFRCSHIFTKSVCYIHYVYQSTHISAASTGWMDGSLKFFTADFYENMLMKPKFS